MLSTILKPEAIVEVLKGARKGIHGVGHWFNVSRVGILLAEATGGDTTVALLFGFYHDCRRDSDGYDPLHGERASHLVLEHFHKGWVSISQVQLDALVEACSGHSKGYRSRDPVVSACWDADRLDLPRVGTQTDPTYLGSDVAKDLAFMQKDFYNGDWEWEWP